MKKSILLILCVFLLSLSHAQTGRVIDVHNCPIPGVLVSACRLDSTEIKSITTGITGQFNLQSIEKTHILRFQHISYVSSFVSCVGDDVGDVTLEDRITDIGSITISPKDMTQFDTHKSYRISEKDKEKYADFLHVLNEIPVLSVGIDNKISYMGISSVKVLLNGVNSSANELLALNPDDVARIEVYDSPPARFAAMGLSSVVNIITKKNITGGTISLNLQDAAKPIYGNNSLGGTYIHKNSRWSINYDNTIRRNKRSRLSEELSYTFDDRDYSKIKKGTNSPFNWDVNSVQLGYMYSKQDKYQFNITGSTERQNRVETNYQSLTYHDGSTYDALQKEENKYQKYSLDLYWNQIISNKKNFLINLTGTFFKSNLVSHYSENSQEIGSTNFDSSSKINGYKPSLIADIRYSHGTKIGVFSLGIRDNLQHNLQEINTKDKPTTITTTSNQVYAYGELSGQFKQKFYYYASFGLEYYYSQNSVLNLSYCSLLYNPRIRINYQPNDNLNLFITYRLHSTAPTISMLSEVPLSLDRKYYFQGNPSLKPFDTHSLLLGMYYQRPQFTFACNLSMDHSPWAIQPYISKSDDGYRQTYGNINFSKTYEGVAAVSWYPFKSKILMLKLIGTISRYIMGGSDYKWSHNDWRLITNAQLDLKKISIDLFYQTRSKTITGQFLRRLPAAAYIECLYRPIKSIKVGIGWRYPFFRSYQEGSETHPSAPVRSVKIMATEDYANMLYVRFTYNFSFGRKDNALKKKINNRDSDSGILTR